ncbi:pyocin activator PrtN family protein [Vibrio europaeus]|uniref:Pyocin activator PrtN family protein n=1 Tax=Vibrio europaeus TaxID=300876 RepID=A0A178J9W4_9VIBR|nr:pyocin activator PrtN family protein [Vibrio europaeus]MDC5702972.1 pyocin activator PrtN family protein [Vibrio europaeus]MDC5708796.1 pyocin activator PrtN family protein [Vibrio europaeus]MDC5712864.1 pyocin activator PrtN family protein [Vibrio europaeus]MDC5725284.1 pyocin activator PrtN family protein [Vibrio europaeus]MDC5731852.1 pyocin activator PrtN family protein [Vibrio europaeus]
MNVSFALLALHGPTVQLNDICDKYLGITPKTASQRAKAADLPFPVFKLRDSERAPYMVETSELATFLESQMKAAKDEWLMVHGRA